MLHSLIQSISSLVSLFYLTSAWLWLFASSAEPGLTQGNYLIKLDLNTVQPRPKQGFGGRDGTASLVLLCVIFLTYMCCPLLCSHGGWLLLKCSAIGIGFNGAETNCGIARILGILLMNSWDL